MTLVTASIDIDAPREKVFDTVLDPERLDEWVTIHRKVNDADGGRPHEGYEMEQTLCLRGVNFKVKWTLTQYENEFKAPGGFLGKAASRVLVGGQPQKEATQSLKQLKGLLERA